MTIELKNESTGVKHFLETINELSNIDNSLNEEVDNFAKSIRDRYLRTQKQEATKKSKWAKLAEEIHEKSPLDGVSEEANKLFKQFREESSF